MADTGFIGGIINSATNLINGFNYKKQENDVLIAQSNAQMMQAQAQMNQPSNTGKTIAWVVGITVVGILLFMVFKPQKTT